MTDIDRAIYYMSTQYERINESGNYTVDDMVKVREHVERVKEIVEKKHISSFHRDQLNEIRDLFIENNRYHLSKPERTDMSGILLSRSERERYVEEFKHNFLCLIEDFNNAGINVGIEELLENAKRTVDYLVPEGYNAGVNLLKVLAYLRKKQLYVYANLEDPESTLVLTEAGINYINHSENYKRVLR